MKKRDMEVRIKRLEAQLSEARSEAGTNKAWAKAERAGRELDKKQSAALSKAFACFLKRDPNMVIKLTRAELEAMEEGETVFQSIYTGDAEFELITYADMRASKPK